MTETIWDASDGVWIGKHTNLAGGIFYDFRSCGTGQQGMPNQKLGVLFRPDPSHTSSDVQMQRFFQQPGLRLE